MSDNKPLYEETVSCPFCGERDFDLVGLKGHLIQDCEDFKDTESPIRVFGK